MSEDYTPKVGDRVRVTYEGSVESLGSRGGFRVAVANDGDVVGSGHYNWLHTAFEGLTIEKLPDPEPEWVNGDVVRRTFTEGLEPLVRIQDEWRTVRNGLRLADRELSRSWDRGSVKILLKADAEQEKAA